MTPRWREHLPEYAAEALGLGLFMMSACGFGVLLFHPGSPAVLHVPQGSVRGLLMGAAMGLTAIANVYSPWGRRSGSHLNPAVTLTFLRLGKIAPRDAVAYVAAQFAGALIGTWLAVRLLGPAIGHPAVNFVITRPGKAGTLVAFGAELAISLGLMLVVLSLTSRPSLAPFTGWAAGAIVMLYITFEAPVSGMSMNPARTTGSAVFAHHWAAIWIYFTAPPLGMLLAAELFGRVRRAAAPYCAKLYHDDGVRCIFCGHQPR